MDYLRTLGSAAVSSLVQKSGLNLPFALGAKVVLLDGICTLYDGTKRDDGTNVSIFEYDFSQRKELAPIAKNALRKLRTTRHPDVLKFMDAVESDTSIFIMTERVRPLQSTLDSWKSKSVQERSDWLLWGLHRISVALAFVNESCASTHGNIRINSVFISPSGEWRLGGFELLSNPTDPAAVLYTMGHIIPDTQIWSSPEVKKEGWSVLKESAPSGADAYALGLLLNATFNPTFHPPPTATPPHQPPTAASRHDIPAAIFPLFKKLVNPNPKARLTAKGFLEIGMTDLGFFASNRLVKVCSGLDGFAVASEAEKATLLRSLNESVGSFPAEFATHRILPSLVSALEFGGANAATILPLVLQFSKNVSGEEYASAILGPLAKLYASPDRGTRMALLDHLPEYVDKLDKKTVESKIFPHLQTGFSDTVAVIREATLKAVILIAPKLSDRVLNNDLLRHLAKLQSDPEASIRTNTCILIGRLGPTLGYHTKRKVLVPAFSRALKDGFVHARVAGLMAFMATIECFDIDDVATKVIPNISPSLIDKEKLVRDQAFKVVDLFVKKLESHAATMPDTVIPESTDPTASPAAATTQAALVNSAAGAAGALAGWAISSLGKRLAATDMQSTMASGPGAPIGRPTSVPPEKGTNHLDGLRPSPLITSLSAAPSAASSPALTGQKSISKSKGMQLGSNRVAPSVLVETWAGEGSNLDPWDSTSHPTSILVDPWAEEKSNDNPWSNEDLMDVNADQDDWSAFETAPTIAHPQPVSAAISNFGGLGNGQPSSYGTPSKIPAITTSPPQTDSWDEEGSWDASDTRKVTTPLPTPTTAIMSKEEKAAEMTRRKEERRQRIAMLKEQKKSGAKS